MVRRLKLGPKFTLILSIVFIGGIIASGLASWEGLQGRAQAEVTDKGLTLIKVMNAVRDYTTNQISPLLAAQAQNQATFVSETVPAFSARTVFDTFRQGPAYASFFYKEAALDPTNVGDLADSFEAELVQRMRSDPTVTSLSGFRQRDNQWVYYTAWPLTVSSQSCLVCHSDPQNAPANLLATYGSKNGFGWQLGQVIAAQMLYVPAEEVLAAARRSFVIVMAIVVGLLAIVLILINFLLRRDVIRPIGVMASLARKLSADETVAADLESEGLVGVAARPDELGQLASVFRQMAQEVYARTQRLKQQVQELRIQIDDVNRRQHVTEVTETDFFRRLQEQAHRLRGQRTEGEAEEKPGPEDSPAHDNPPEDV